MLMLKRTLHWLLTAIAVITFGVLWQTSASAKTYTPTKEFVVNDYANILTDDTKQMIINQEKVFQQTKEKPQVVVVTVKSTGGQSIRDWTNDLLESSDKWKAGNKDYNNGVVIVFAQNKGANNVRIATGRTFE